MDSSNVEGSPQPHPSIFDVAIALADEGVPVRAIARATKTPGENVYEILKSAIGQGLLLEIPRDDWPSRSTRRDRTQADNILFSTDQPTIRIVCSTCFKFTPLESTVFVTTLRRSAATREHIHHAIEQNRNPADEITDQKMVDVVMCRIRKKLKPFDIKIDTVWGVGYVIKQEYRDRAIEIITAEIARQKGE